MSFPPSDPDRLPPPSYDNKSTQQWAAELKRTGGGPPLRGLAVDPAYPPTPRDAERVLQKMRSENREKSLAENTPIRTLNQDNLDNEDGPSDIRRGSGASKIFGAAPSTSEIINTMPGGDAHAAGKRVEEIPDPTIKNAFKTISTSSLTSFHQQPCVRDALLTGMFVGVGFGGTAWVIGRSILFVQNLAVGTFIPTAVANYSYCQWTRKREKEGMRAAVQIVEEKKEEKRQRVEKLREERRLKKEAANTQADATASKGSRRTDWLGIWRGRPGEREG